MFVECPRCAARVDAQKIATFDYPEEWDYSPDALQEVSPGTKATEDNTPRERWTLLVCRICTQVMLASQEDWDGQWSEPERIFPPEQRPDLPIEVPQGIRDSLQEASQNLRSGAYRSAAVMCRCAIEGVCRHYGAGPGLGRGLPELRKLGIIDGMLLQWAEALRLHGNIASHADSTPISKDDATDLFDFAVAICQYVFVLGEKFRNFRARTRTGEQGTTAVQ